MIESNSFTGIVLKLMLFTGIRNDELVNITIKDVDLDQMRIQINQWKGGKDRYVLFPPLLSWGVGSICQCPVGGAVYLFESNRLTKFTTRWIREIVKNYARKAGINKGIHPHIFRYQLLTYLTSKGIVDAKIQLISGHKSPDSLSIYKDLSLADVNKEYWEVMEDFPIQ